MPLKLVRRAGSGVWQITGTIGNKRVRETTGTMDRSTAEQMRAKREGELYRGEIYGPASVKTWEDAVDRYITDHPPSPATDRLLERLTDHFGRTLLKDIGQEAAVLAADKLCAKDASPATRLRNVISPIRAVLHAAAVMGWCAAPALKAPAGAGGKKRTRWLRPEEAQALVAAAAPHLRPLIVFIYCTGARLREALSLEWGDVDLPNARAVFRDVKSRPGEQRDRHVDLPPAAIAALSSIVCWVMVDGKAEPTDRRAGAVFRRDDGLAYASLDRDGGGQIKTAWATACRNAGFAGAWSVGAAGYRWWTPSDVTPHVLRHTWASWHYAVHRDVLKLKEDGDWSSVSLVERYTKLVPQGMVADIRAMWLGGQAQIRHAAAS